MANNFNAFQGFFKKIALATGTGLSVAVFAKWVHLNYIQEQEHYEVDIAENVMNGMTLKSVQVFFRHGARTPLSHLPNVEEVRKLHPY